MSVSLDHDPSFFFHVDDDGFVSVIEWSHGTERVVVDVRRTFISFPPSLSLCDFLFVFVMCTILF